MVLKYINILLIICPIWFSSCSCENNGNVGDIPNTPGWVAKQYSSAMADKAVYDAMEYCDKPSKRKLENDYYYLVDLPEIEFVKVDSCDLYEDHAYCYCHYKSEDSVSYTEKLLLRNFDNYWKVHYDPEVSKAGESRLYSNALIERSDYSLSFISLSDKVKEDLDLVIEEMASSLNHSDFIVGFFPLDKLDEAVKETQKEHSYDDYYSRVINLENFYANITVYFDYNDVLEKYNVSFLDVPPSQFEGMYQYLIENMIEEFGKPYNVKKTPVNKLYRYEEIKWFLKGFNEELIISSSYQNITVSLTQAL